MQYPVTTAYSRHVKVDVSKQRVKTLAVTFLRRQTTSGDVHKMYDMYIWHNLLKVLY